MCTASDTGQDLDIFKELKTEVLKIGLILNPSFRPFYLSVYHRIMGFRSIIIFMILINLFQILFG
jgi:hypothetical protein